MSDFVEKDGFESLSDTKRLSQSLSEVAISDFTDEEIAAVRETKRLLTEEHGLPHSKLSKRELFIVTLNCKLRPETAAIKYKKWLQAISEYGLHSFDDVWEGLSDDPNSDEMWDKLKANFSPFAGCGRDKLDRAVFWIKGRPVVPDEERIHIRCTCIYYIAIHADLISLRNGITFVIDTTHNPMEKLVGNERKLQKVYQSVPLRPQRIFILGTSFIKRVVINAIISFASLFTSEKVIDRIRFVELDEVRASVADESLPAYIGGGGGGLHSQEDLLCWIRQRLRDIYRVPDI